jgi:hypothetical protein
MKTIRGLNINRVICVKKVPVSVYGCEFGECLWKFLIKVVNLCGFGNLFWMFLKLV